ncbi:FecR family protein [Parapedobacter indicus]|nr:FecR domain-containing protein [Parapedobacter indicus]
MDIDPELVRRYWENTCSPQERKQVEQWLSAGEPDEVYPIGDDMDETQLRQTLWPQAIPQGQPSKRSDRRRRLNLLGYAAAALVLCTSCWAIWFSGILQPDQREISPSSYQSVTAHPGKKLQITLSDGTVVHLNSGSTLRYPLGFGQRRRHVLLEGEAYFEVAKESRRTFVAETPHIKAYVLGTSFNVSDYPDAPACGLVLESGKVAVVGGGHADTLVLHPNDRVEFSAGQVSMAQVDAADYIGWHHNILRLPDITLRQAIPLIERWYGVKITVSPASLADLRIKASFENATLQKFAADLSYLMNFHYRIANDALHLYR